jgi:hypothetical protein
LAKTLIRVKPGSCNFISFDILKRKLGRRSERYVVLFYPGTPRLKAVRPHEDIEGLNENMQSTHRSGVRMLLYKHSRPDIANVGRELSKCMDSATMAA